MSILSYGHCCGVAELDGIEYCSPELLLIEVVNYVSGHNDDWNYTTAEPEVTPKILRAYMYPFVYYASGQKKYTSRMTKYIRKHGLGDVWESPPKYNPTGSPRLRVCVWTPNTKALYYWYKGVKK